MTLAQRSEESLNLAQEIKFMSFWLALHASRYSICQKTIGLTIRWLRLVKLLDKIVQSVEYVTKSFIDLLLKVILTPD